jgi:YidC/Oxa1 family membrane protein insertase
MFPVANVLQPLIDFSEAILRFFHDTVGFGWGFSIIWLTFVIRLIILPLTFKQVRSMQSLQRLQPEMKRLQERYKGDRTRLNEEMMKFYREHKVNPAGACLPVLFQLPFFLALFYMLRHDLRLDICGQAKVPCGKIPGDHGQSFFFVHDITSKATGVALAVLIVLYVGSQLVSGLITTVTADKQQRIIMLALPFLFVTFIFNFEAGLIIYWITTNTWTIGQQLFVKRFLPPPEPLPASPDDDGEPKPARGKPATAMSTVSEKEAGGKGKPAKGAAGANGGSDGGAPKPPPARRKKKRSGRRR